MPISTEKRYYIDGTKMLRLLHQGLDQKILRIKNLLTGLMVDIKLRFKRLMRLQKIFSASMHVSYFEHFPVLEEKHASIK